MVAEIAFYRQLGLKDTVIFVDTEGDRRTGRIVETRVHESIGEDDRIFETELTIAGVDGRRDRLLGHVLVDDVEREPLGNDFREQSTADRGLHHATTRLLLAVLDDRLVDADGDASLQVYFAGFVSAMRLTHIGEHHALTLRTHALTGHVVETQNDVLRRNDDRIAVRG